MPSHKPPYHFGKDKVTRNAVTEFFLFVAVVLFLFFIFGGFESW